MGKGLEIFLLNGEMYVETGNGLRKLYPHEKEICLNDNYWIKGEYLHD
jgi:hypothetical protein